MSNKKLIGKGPMSTVYKIDNYITKKGSLCMKILNEEHLESPDVNERFIKINSIFLKLNHPNIIKAYGFYIGDKTRTPLFVLDYTNSNLEKVIKSLNDGEIIQIIRQICSAMIEFHSKNIIHYDLIPKNILINQEKQVKIANISTLNSIKYRCKSKIFSAPEIGTQKTEHLKNRKAIDVYAFGVNLCYIVSKGQKTTIPNIENFLRFM